MSSLRRTQVTTNYSFLRGASTPRSCSPQAALLGLPALGITDRNSLAGIVRAHQRAEERACGWSSAAGSICTDGTSLLVYPTDRAAYRRLCRLLTLGKGRAGKGGCDLDWDDLAAHGEGCSPSCCRTSRTTACDATLTRLRADFRRPRLSRADPAPPPGRCGAAAPPRRAAAAARRADRRHRRRALSRAAAAASCRTS